MFVAAIGIGFFTGYSERSIAIGGLLLLLVAAVAVAGVFAPMTSAAPWWMHPSVLFAVAGLVALLTAALPSATTFLMNWGQPKLLTDYHYFTLTLYALLAVVGGVIAARPGERLARPDLDPRAAVRLGIAARVLVALSVFGYSVWFGLAVVRGLRPSDVIGVLSGAAHATVVTKYQYLETIPGITTMTQFAGPAVVALLLSRRLGDHRPVAKLVALLVGLAVIRALIHQEREALLEIAVPLLIVLALDTVSRGGRGGLRRTRMAAAPILVPVLLVLVFGTFEYGRSWQNYYSIASDKSYPEFVTDRLTGYFATATNNSALIVKERSTAPTLPYFSIKSLWEMPGVSQLKLYERVSGRRPSEIASERLVALSNPEFNNPGGWMLARYDFGFIGGGVFWLVIGLGFGLLFSQVRRGSIAAWLVFPVLFVGFVDLPRFLYWAEGRALPAILGAVLCGWFVVYGDGRIARFAQSGRRLLAPAR